jgi:hypothetical protein
MQAFEIPLTPEPQVFTTTLGEQSYRCTVKWSSGSEAWVLDLARMPEGTTVVTGLPLVTGVDLLAPYRHLGFTGALVVQSAGDPDEVPTRTSLGTTGILYFVVE